MLWNRQSAKCLKYNMYIFSGARDYVGLKNEQHPISILETSKWNFSSGPGDKNICNILIRCLMQPKNHMFLENKLTQTTRNSSENINNS